MQVPTTRSSESWGIGDLADVRTVARWVRERGGGALGLSPLHAPTPVAPIQTSPYYPPSRRWRIPILMRVDKGPGAAAAPAVRRRRGPTRGDATSVGSGKSEPAGV